MLLFSRGDFKSFKNGMNLFGAFLKSKNINKRFLNGYTLLANIKFSEYRIEMSVQFRYALAFQSSLRKLFELDRC